MEKLSTKDKLRWVQEPDQLFDSRWYQSADEQAYDRVTDRLDCAADCPLYDEALNFEAYGDYVGALAVLIRHRTHRCQWASSCRRYS